MPRSLLLINPNTSATTTKMMLAAARAVLGGHVRLRGITAANGTRMLLNDGDIAVAAQEVVRIGRIAAKDEDCVVIAAFGNPGLDELRRSVACEVVGIGEAAVLEAATDRRRFGIVTTTPDLKASIERGVESLSLCDTFVGVRIARGNPLVLAEDPDAQYGALHDACVKSFEVDGAEAVIIGGGPLSGSAATLQEHFGDVIIQPIAAAMRLCLRRMGV